MSISFPASRILVASAFQVTALVVLPPICILGGKYILFRYA